MMMRAHMKMFSPLMLSAVLTGACVAPLAAKDSLRAETAEPIHYDKGIEKYVRFLEKQKQTPANYILGLFQQNDMVILCERAHPEITQYDLIYQVVSDPRFQQQAGHIFTEIGAEALRPYIESFLVDNQLNEAQVNEKLRYIARNIGHDGGWEKTSFYVFLRKLYYLNRSSPKDRRVHVYPSDLDFRWANATKGSWAEFKNTQLSRRDRFEADSIISKFNEIRQTADRKKALVVMNYRHAFPNLKDFGSTQNVGGFLMEAYPGLVANVMLNSVSVLPGSTDMQSFITPLQQGKWDAAFAVLKNPNAGFDFKGSPLGEDGFDYWPFPTHLRYQDVFTGFVLFEPLHAHRMSIGLPAGLFDREFADELLQRFRITGDDLTAQEVKKMFGTVHVFGYDFGYESLPSIYKAAFGQPDYAKKIQRWLKASP